MPTAYVIGAAPDWNRRGIRRRRGAEFTGFRVGERPGTALGALGENSSPVSERGRMAEAAPAEYVYPVNALFLFAGIELGALLVLVALIMAAPEAVEDERGFRVVGPSLWQRFRRKLAAGPAPSKLPRFPSMHGPTHA